MLVATGPIPLSRTMVFYDFDFPPEDGGRSEMVIASPSLATVQPDNVPDREATAPYAVADAPTDDELRHDLAPTGPSEIIAQEGVGPFNPRADLQQRQDRSWFGRRLSLALRSSRVSLGRLS